MKPKYKRFRIEDIMDYDSQGDIKDASFSVGEHLGTQSNSRGGQLHRNMPTNVDNHLPAHLRNRKMWQEYYAGRLR